uniref:Uncharacterized protein n=1 Tax=Knipowitschia caucasica TaxID=637954 RepID=A0AAV2MEP3_KNICA
MGDAWGRGVTVKRLPSEDAASSPPVPPIKPSPPSCLYLDDSASSLIYPRPSECPPKPTGLAESGPQTRYPERRQDEKSLPFEVCEKVDGLFHDRRLSSAHCEGGPGSRSSPNAKDRRGRRKNQEDQPLFGSSGGGQSQGFFAQSAQKKRS